MIFFQGRVKHDKVIEKLDSERELLLYNIFTNILGLWNFLGLLKTIGSVGATIKI